MTSRVDQSNLFKKYIVHKALMMVAGKPPIHPYPWIIAWCPYVVILSIIVIEYLSFESLYIAPPAITTKPQQDTVSHGENAFFHCTAKGYPLPTISWMHNGRIVTDSHRDYLVTPNNEGSALVSSDLRIISTSTYATGQVTCIASAIPPEDSDITLANHNASTSLTVLGKVYNIYSPLPLWHTLCVQCRTL